MIKPSRRGVLRGLGAAISLPWLASRLAPAAAASDVPVKRLVVLYIPNGALPEYWVPSTVGPQWTPSPLLTPISAVTRHVSVISGLSNTAGDPALTTVANHPRLAMSALTAQVPTQDPVTRAITAGTSFDQHIAAQIGHLTPWSSLTLGSESAAICDINPCAGLTHVSWLQDAPVAKEIHPYQLFSRLFGASTTADDVRATRARLARRQSVLDFVQEDVEAIQRTLGAGDRQRLDAYLTGIRAVEQAMSFEATACTTSSWPAEPTDHGDHVEQMLNLTRLAMQCDMTRVTTHMLANERGHVVFGLGGRPESHHGRSHHTGFQDRKDAYNNVVHWYMTKIAAFLESMAQADEGEQSLLDQSAVLVLSGMGDGDLHSHHDLPVLLAGNLGGTLQPGQHIATPSGTPLANLLLTLLQRFDVPMDRFGVSTGALPLT